MLSLSVSYCVVCFSLWLLESSGALFASSVSRTQDSSNDLFASDTVPQLRLEVDKAGIASLGKNSRKSVAAKLTEGTNVYEGVGLHLKGHSTFQPIDGEKPNFTVKFNLNKPGQKFHGLAKISLNNSTQDPSYINEVLCADRFRALGVPVGRVAHARVWLNGRYLGFYVLVEGIAKDFLKLNFGNTDGNMYEANAEDIDEALEQINGADSSQADRKSLLATARIADAQERWQHLQAALDVPRFVSMLAGDVLLSHWDGYYRDANNYRLYHDGSTGRFVMIPHGMDNMFQLAEVDWRPELNTILTQAVLQTEAGQNLYRERFWGAYDGPFRTPLLLAKVDAIASRIRPAVAEDGTNALANFNREVAKLRERIRNRMNFLAQELAELSPRLGLGVTGSAKLTGWQRKIESGTPTLDFTEDGGKPGFRIDANQPIKAAWLTRARLDAGSYVFHARVRTTGVIPLANEEAGGAGLSVSGKNLRSTLSGDSSWKILELPFEIPLSGEAVELVCELRCQSGSAWFESESLKLVRVK
jgi:spore coat protein CotH